ncbi:MAG: ribonuclease H-like domain-containing protein [Candidatus Colwellbacteria bacterium]|nr:ribonuclease H-like domain-containing protein [Candidatus Colwellbacteria bacterium]
MKKDILVIDIETKNTIFDVGGEANIKDLDTSLVCLYSYNDNEYRSFWEKDFGDLRDAIKESALVIGFGINRFDLPVLNKYFDFNTEALKRIDLLEEIEAAYGRRISLDLLANRNLGVGKTHKGLDAIKFWNEGNLEELESYCRNDVKVTKELFDLAKTQGYLMVPQKGTDEAVRVALELNSKIDGAINENTLF